MSHTERQDVTYYSGHVIEVSGTRYAQERTCKRVSIYSLFFRESYKGCSECHNPLSALDIYCSKCGAKVI